jgi:hypothetical protein
VRGGGGVTGSGRRKMPRNFSPPNRHEQKSILNNLAKAGVWGQKPPFETKAKHRFAIRLKYFLTFSTIY